MDDQQARQFIGSIRRFNCDCGKWMILPPSVLHDDPLQCECGAMYWIDDENIQHCHAPQTQLMIAQEQLNDANKEIEHLKRQLHAQRTDKVLSAKMPRDDALYPLWIKTALRHARYWMRKMGMTAAQRQAVWRFMMESER